MISKGSKKYFWAFGRGLYWRGGGIQGRGVLLRNCNVFPPGLNLDLFTKPCTWTHIHCISLQYAGSLRFKLSCLNLTLSLGFWEFFSPRIFVFLEAFLLGRRNDTVWKWNLERRRRGGGHKKIPSSLLGRDLWSPLPFFPSDRAVLVILCVVCVVVRFLVSHTNPHKIHHTWTTIMVKFFVCFWCLLLLLLMLLLLLLFLVSLLLLLLLLLLSVLLFFIIFFSVRHVSKNSQGF